jgi:hypothetical protein
MEYIIGAGLITTVGYDLLIKTLQKSTENVCYLLTHLHSRKDCKEIREIDLYVQIQCIKNSVDFISNKVSMHDHEHEYNLMKPIIHSINESLSIIERELLEIQNKIKYNNELWIPYIFSISLDKNVNNIVLEKKILDSRFNMFIKLVNIQK